jgi:hypothetical protein
VKHDEPIDIMTLYAKSDTKQWNAFLTECLKTQDITRLTTVRYRLQLGMNELFKKRLETEKISLFFIRLQRSIENTLKQIYRFKNPNPLYNNKDKTQYKEFIDDKRQHNNEFERYLRRNNF